MQHQFLMSLLCTVYNKKTTLWTSSILLIGTTEVQIAFNSQLNQINNAPPWQVYL